MQIMEAVWVQADYEKPSNVSVEEYVNALSNWELLELLERALEDDFP